MAGALVATAGWLLLGAMGPPDWVTAAASGGSGDQAAPAPRPVSHQVADGESLAEIAARYEVDAGRMARANAVDDADALVAGQMLFVPDPDAPRPGTPAEAVAAGLPVADLLVDQAQAAGVDPALAQAVAWQESRWNQRVHSEKDAIGVMQLLPATAEAVAADLGEELDPYDLTDNVRGGAAYLAKLSAQHDGDVADVLASYYQGAGSVARNGRFAVTETYIDDVLAYREEFARLR